MKVETKRGSSGIVGVSGDPEFVFLKRESVNLGEGGSGSTVVSYLNPWSRISHQELVVPMKSGKILQTLPS